jgi:hypothetical protein
VTGGLPAGLTVVGTAPGSGKSLLTRSLAVLRLRSGQPVSFYKPVAVAVQPVATPFGDIDHSMMLATRAVRMAEPTAVCDFTYAGARLRELATGWSAPARLLSEDGVDFGTLGPDAVARVRLAIARRVATSAFLICEGAGSAVDASAAYDLSNSWLASSARRPVVFVVSARQAGALAGLVGTRHLWPAAAAGLVRGFVLNNATDLGPARELAARMEAGTGWPCLAVVPRIPLYADLPARGSTGLTGATWDEELLEVAQFVGGHLTPALHALLGETEPAV